MAEYKLTYYNFRSQQGEPIRLIFAYAGVPFEDIRIPPGDTYPVLPAHIKEELPYGHLPILEYKGHTISQSPAIGKFLAKQFGLIGADDIEAAKCDEIVDALFDFQMERWMVSMEKDPATETQMQKRLMDYVFPKYMGRFNQIAKDNGGKFLVGKSITWADLHNAHFINMMEEKSPELLKPYPDLHKSARYVLDLPQIKKWNTTRPKDDPPQLHSGVVL